MPRLPERLCQCADWPLQPCGREMTQEDLLCDGCRKARATPMGGCCVIQMQGEPARHVRWNGPVARSDSA